MRFRSRRVMQPAGPHGKPCSTFVSQRRACPRNGSPSASANDAKHTPGAVSTPGGIARVMNMLNQNMGGFQFTTGPSPAPTPRPTTMQQRAAELQRAAAAKLAEAAEAVAAAKRVAASMVAASSNGVVAAVHEQVQTRSSTTNIQRNGQMKLANVVEIEVLSAYYAEGQPPYLEQKRFSNASQCMQRCRQLHRCKFGTYTTAGSAEKGRCRLAATSSNSTQVCAMPCISFAKRLMSTSNAASVTRGHAAGVIESRFPIAAPWDKR